MTRDYRHNRLQHSWFTVSEKYSKAYDQYIPTIMRLKLLPNDQLWAPEKLLRQGTKIPSGKKKRYIFCLRNKCINDVVFVNALGTIYAQNSILMCLSDAKHC